MGVRASPRRSAPSRSLGPDRAAWRADRRELQSNAVPRVQIVLDANPAATAGRGRTAREWGVRVAASLAEGWSREGAEVELVLDRGRFPARGGTPRRALGGLAGCPGTTGPVSGGALAELLRLPECRSDGGLRIIVTTDIGIRDGSGEIWHRPGDVWIVLQAAAFESDEVPGSTEPFLLPVTPWIRIGGPKDVTTCLRRPGKRRFCLVADRREEVRICWTTQAMAGLAAVALDQAVLEPGRSRAIASAGTVAVLIAPMLAAGWWLGTTRKAVAGAGRSRAANDRRGGLVQAVSNPIAALLSVFGLPFVGAAARFAAGGRGAMVEVLLMAACATWGSAWQRWRTGGFMRGSRPWSVCSW